MNFTLIASIAGLLFGGAVLVGMISHAWRQRSKSDAPESGKFGASILIILATGGVLLYAGPNMLGAAGATAQNLFPSTAPEMPNYQDLLNGGKLNLPTPAPADGR